MLKRFLDKTIGSDSTPQITNEVEPESFLNAAISGSVVVPKNAITLSDTMPENVGIVSNLNSTWETVTGSSLAKDYETLIDYERDYGKTSEEMFKLWKSGAWEMDNEKNEWLITYLRTRDFIYED